MAFGGRYQFFPRVDALMIQFWRPMQSTSRTTSVSIVVVYAVAWLHPLLGFSIDARVILPEDRYCFLRPVLKQQMHRSPVVLAPRHYGR